MEFKICEGGSFKYNDAGNGSFEGHCSVFNNVDRQGERVLPGAFRQHLPEFRKKGCITWNHDLDRPIATIKSAVEDSHGLLVRGEFHSTEHAQEKRAIVRERYDRGQDTEMSFGYKTIRKRKGKDAVVELEEVAPFEASLLSVPAANPLAGVTAIKSGGSMTEWQALHQKARFRNAIEGAGPSWSEQILSSAKWKEATQWGKNVAIELKAAGDPIATGALNIVSAPTAVTPHGVKPYGVLQLLQRVNVTAPQVMITTASYPLINSAAFIAEGAAKPWVEPRWATVTIRIEEVACWTSVSRNALDDVVGLQRTIDVDLASLLGERIADRVINGTGTTPDILGILATPNIITVAYVATTNILDMLISGISQVQSTGYGTVNGIVMNPTDIASLTITKTASGVQYIRPAELPIIVSDAHLAVGTAILGDWSFAALYTRNGPRFEIGYKDNDILINKLSIAASERVGLALSRPQAFAKVALA